MAYFYSGGILNFANVYVVNFFHLNCSFKQNKSWTWTLSLNLEPVPLHPDLGSGTFSVDSLLFGYCFHFFSVCVCVFSKKLMARNQIQIDLVPAFWLPVNVL